MRCNNCERRSAHDYRDQAPRYSSARPSSPHGNCCRERPAGTPRLAWPLRLADPLLAAPKAPHSTSDRRARYVCHETSPSVHGRGPLLLEASERWAGEACQDPAFSGSRRCWRRWTGPGRPGWPWRGKLASLCAPPSRYRSQPVVAASRRPEDPLRSMLRPQAESVHRCCTTSGWSRPGGPRPRGGRDRSGPPGTARGDLPRAPLALQLSSGTAVTLDDRPQRPTPEGHCAPCSGAHSMIARPRSPEGLGSPFPGTVSQGSSGRSGGCP
jgi:hypothetical protein